MKTGNKSKYWVLSGIIFTLVATALLLIRPTYSHYENTTFWNTVLAPTPTTITSNCLVEGGQTILLQELELELDESGNPVPVDIPISLTTAVGVEGTLTCRVSDNAVGVLTVELPETTTGGATSEHLMLTPVLGVHDPVEAEILVTWTVGDEVRSGTFRVTVAAITEADLPVEEEQPPVDEPPSDEPAPEDQPSVDEPVDETVEPEPATTTATEPVELVADEDDRVSLTGVTAFDPAALLPVQAVTAEQGLAMELGLEGEDGTLTDLPPFTRYSTDGGQSYTLLYHGGTIPLAEIEGGGFPLVLLDLSGAGVTPGTTLTLMGQREEEGQLLQCRWTTTGEKLLPADSLNNPKVMQRDNAVIYPLPTAWNGEENNNISVSYAVTMLTETETTDQTTGAVLRQVEYQSVALDGTGSLNAGVTTDESGTSTTLTIRREDGRLPSPGTYHLTLRWSFGGICYAQTEHTFFVNYAVDALAE